MNNRPQPKDLIPKEEEQEDTEMVKSMNYLYCLKWSSSTEYSFTNIAFFSIGSKISL